MYSNERRFKSIFDLLEEMLEVSNRYKLTNIVILLVELTSIEIRKDEKIENLLEAVLEICYEIIIVLRKERLRYNSVTEFVKHYDSKLVLYSSSE